MVSETTAKKFIKGSNNDTALNLSFAGCGFLGIYHVGVASCIKEYAPHLFADQIGGSSAGALVAAAMLTDTCLGEATSYTLRIAGKARQRALGPLHPSFNIGKHLREGLDAFLPDNAHKIANGRLNVSLTRVSDRQNVVVNQFDSKDELVQVLICSSFIPFYCGLLPPKYRGVRYVDGGLSDNIPILNDNTITVSPFAGESDICPTDISSNELHINLVNTSIQCTTTNLYRASYAFFPPHPEILADTCKQGFNDALRFLQKNALINYTRHLTMKSAMVTEEADPNQHVNFSDGDSDDSSLSDCDDCEDCDECDRREEPLSNLPPLVVTALESAIASVNNGLLAPMYNSRAFSVVSLMTAPAILPVDVVVVLAQRLYEWVPYMPSDMQWFVYELKTVIQELLSFIKNGRHQYSARFACQLAITEMDVPSSIEVHGSRTPVASPFVQRCTTMKVTERTHRRRSSILSNHVLPSTRAHRAASGYNGPVHCAEDLRHEMLEDLSHNNFRLQRPRISDTTSHFCGLDSEDEECDDWSLTEVADDETSTLVDDADDAYEQFENVLEVADSTESILAFYYTDEGNPGVVQVTEIFPLDDPSIDKPLEQMRSRSRANSLAARPTRKKNDATQVKPENEIALDSLYQRLKAKSEMQSNLSGSDSHVYSQAENNSKLRRSSITGSRAAKKKSDPRDTNLFIARSESNLYKPSAEPRVRTPNLSSRRKSEIVQSRHISH